MREKLKVDETTWAYVLVNLRAVCIVRRGLRPHEQRSRGTEGKPPGGLRAQPSGKAHDLLRGEVDLSPARVDLWCWVVLFTDGTGRLVDFVALACSFAPSRVNHARS